LQRINNKPEEKAGVNMDDSKQFWKIEASWQRQVMENDIVIL